MQILYLDLSMGAAGDMLMGALASLLDETKQEEFLKKLNGAGIPGVTVSLACDKKCGIAGKHADVRVHGQTEKSEDVHRHDNERVNDGHKHDCNDEMHNEHGLHNHFHASMSEITEIINNLNVSDRVKQEVENVYRRIAGAEGRVHGVDASMVHFHEVGMMDALADITGCALLFEMLDADCIIASPVNTGYGQVKCAHGILPVPAPATALLLRDIPCYSGSIEGELTTPTGAAIIGNYVNSFSGMPLMQIDNIGYGTGHKDFEAANVVRAILGKTADKEDKIIEMNCNLDDITAEEAGYVTKLLMENGAKDVYTVPVTMKKGRPGIILGVLCKPSDKDKLAGLIFKHTTTIGIRYSEKERMVMDRINQMVHTKYGDINVKVSEGFGVKKYKPEYEDLKRIADEKNISFSQIKESIYKSIEY